MDIKTRILKELKRSETYVSGQEMCGKFGVSRTTVWKVINQLKEEGYDINSVTNRGYTLTHSPDILSKSEIDSEIDEYGFIRKVVYFDETDSTNNRAKLMGEENAPHGTLVVADGQRAGRGRRGRSFSSPRGSSIYMTFLLRPDITPDKASLITILSGMAVRKALEEACAVDCRIKWPNDIVVQGKKICGILSEMSAEVGRVNYIVVGMGINVNNERMPEDISNVAVSVRMITGKQHKRSRIIARVAHWFGIYYDKFAAWGNLSDLRDEYNKYLIHMDEEIEVISDSGRYKAISRGIAPNGELIIEREGRQEIVVSGEVSVRGLYGYV